MELFIFHLVECHLITGRVNRGLWVSVSIPVPVFCIVAVVLSWEVMMGSLVFLRICTYRSQLFLRCCLVIWIYPISLYILVMKDRPWKRILTIRKFWNLNMNRTLSHWGLPPLITTILLIFYTPGDWRAFMMNGLRLLPTVWCVSPISLRVNICFMYVPYLTKKSIRVMNSAVCWLSYLLRCGLLRGL